MVLGLFAPGKALIFLKSIEVHVVAHVALRRGAQGLEIPRIVGPIAQRLINDPAARLRLTHVRIEGFEVPTGSCLNAESLKGLSMVRIFGEVVQLIRVGVQIKKLFGINRAIGVFPTPFTQTYQRRVRPLRRVFHRNRGLTRLPIP